MKVTKAALIASLDKFTLSYITAALWSSNDESTPQGGEPMDRNYSIDDLTIDCLLKMQKDCKEFQEQNSRALNLADYSHIRARGHDFTDSEFAGHDFWLTRCGHGVGFWDRGLRLCLGDILTKACEKFGEANLYVHKKKIYHY